MLEEKAKVIHLSKRILEVICKKYNFVLGNYFQIDYLKMKFEDSYLND